MSTYPAGYGEAALPFRLSTSVTGMVTWGFKEDTALSNPTGIAEVIYDCWFDTLRNLCDSSVTWGPVEVSLGPSSAPLSGSGTSSSIGGAIINCPPPNSAVLVQKRSNTGGRKGRGRFFWPYVADEGAVDEAGVWAPASAANLQTAMDNFLGRLTTDLVPMHILHNDGSTPSAVTQLVVQTQLATQRRRLRR